MERNVITPHPKERLAENVDAILDYFQREQAKISSSQRILERIGRGIGRPTFVFAILGSVALWIAAQAFTPLDFDPPPYFWLQGILGLCSLLIAMIILITQNRQSNIEAIHAQLDLQVNLLTEHKISKVIELIEELRRDLPMVRDRKDHTAEAMQEPADAQRMLHVLDEKGVGEQLGGASTEDRGAPKHPPRLDQDAPGSY